ncbi:MAG: glycosyltransferase family 4 protein [Acidobacteria bacterium]|nr:glycosyltransferase family 4 protein [Acidobacteriota bacterium]
MRVALDAIPLAAPKTGIGHYTDSLAEWLARIHTDHQYELISPFDFPFDACGRHGHSPKPENLSRKFIPVRSIFKKWWLLGLPAFLQISPLDVFHGTNYCVPVFAPCPTVVTIHDLSLLAHSGTHETDNVIRGRRRMPIMARRARKIIAPSEWTKREIIEFLGIKPGKIQVIHEGAREKMLPLPESNCQSVLERFGIKKPYLLFVGTIEPRKNLTTLIRAYDTLLRETEHRPQLVLCGGRGWLDGEVFSLVEKLKLQEQVLFTGYVEDSDLPALYSSAEAFIYPSLYEGFGLPPLEAMACGTPVITSNSSSLPEVVGKAGLMHDPEDHLALTRSIVEILSDKDSREHFIRAGLEQASRFSWDRAARETQAVYDEVYQQWKKRK